MTLCHNLSSFLVVLAEDIHDGTTAVHSASCAFYKLFKSCMCRPIPPFYDPWTISASHVRDQPLCRPLTFAQTVSKNLLCSKLKKECHPRCLHGAGIPWHSTIEDTSIAEQHSLTFFLGLCSWMALMPIFAHVSLPPSVAASDTSRGMNGIIVFIIWHVPANWRHLHSTYCCTSPPIDGSKGQLHQQVWIGVVGYFQRQARQEQAFSPAPASAKSPVESVCVGGSKSNKQPSHVRSASWHGTVRCKRATWPVS
jgi:hypothetical protein